MASLFWNSHERHSRKGTGQVLVVVALSMVVIVAIVGLALDVGMMFIGNARLRRAVDAAALGAALQYRKGVAPSALTNTAIEYMLLNGVTLSNDHPLSVDTCDTLPSLCYDAGQGRTIDRKLVRVYATATIELAFLRVLSINTANIAAEAVSEAASVDIVLVLDTSDSMTWTANPGDAMRDPSVCNNPDDPQFDPGYFTDKVYDSTYKGFCQPFDDVKKAAVEFVNRLYFPYDRVAVVTFDKVARVRLRFNMNCDIDLHPSGCTPDQIKATIQTAIKGLEVYPGDGVFPDGLPSRWYDDAGGYWGLDCPQTYPEYALDYPDYPDPAPCTTTNIGAGLYTAGVEFNNDSRQGALWVVIMLTDGVANAGFGNDGTYFCPGGPDTGGEGQPPNTWDNTDIPPKCNDGISETDSDNRPAVGDDDYDAEDYAYDSADFVAHSFPDGQGATIFTIGLGNKVTQLSTVDNTPLGENFLLYAANQGQHFTSAERNKIDQYTFQPDTAGLDEVFRKIAEKIVTKLAH
jgi:hypothetical protein